jgi:hypothetical protein
VTWADVRGDGRSEERVLDSGTHGVRWEVGADGGLLVRLPSSPERGRERTALRVTEYEPGSVVGERERVTEHVPSADGLVWLYGLREGMRYALWWGPDSEGRFVREAAVSLGDAHVEPALREGVPLRLEVVRPLGWDGWPQVRALARGVEVFGTWTSEGTCTFPALPDEELWVRAEGRDATGRTASGDVRLRPGVARRVEMSLR